MGENLCISLRKPYNIHVKKHQKKESAIYSKTYLLYTEDT